MIHHKRAYKVTLDRYDVDSLARALTEHSWTLCTSFNILDIVLFNDSFSEDGAQEYAVYRVGEGQIESLTVSWMTFEFVRETLLRLIAGSGELLDSQWPSIDHPKGTCHLCA
jgi:hypothetical protein